MEISTPMINKNVMVNQPSRDLYRRSILKNAVDASPLRRRSLLPTTPAAPLEQINDENERSSRRSLVDIQRRLSNIPHGTSPLNESNKFLGEQDMKDHFKICTKLFTENKITPKNAWRLHIIDLLKHIAQKQDTDTLQVAGTSLDISAKVYSIRVDDIHSDGLKLASSMSRVSDKQLPQDDDNVDLEDGADKENAAAKKKKKKKRLLAGEKNTICKDPKTIEGSIPKLDSVFFSTRTDAESSAIDNLFTNRLKMDNSGYKFMLLSNEKAWTVQTDPVIQILKEPNRKKYPFDVDPLTFIKLCTPFNDFQLDEWDPEEEEKQLASKNSLIEKQQEVVFDDDGVPIHELDGSIHDIFEHPPDDADDDIQSIHEIVAPQIRGGITNIVEFNPDISSGLHRSEYSYNSVVTTFSGKLIDQIWAGPSHWKLKFIRRTTARFSGQVMHHEKQSKGGRKRAHPKMIDFNANYEEFDITKKLKIKKKPPTVDTHKITLPVPDTSCMNLMEHIRDLMIKPGVCPVKKKPTAENQVDYEVSAYKYENPNDSQYCSQHSSDPDGGNAEPHCDDNDDCDDIEEHRLAQQEFLGENLVDAPEAVPKSYVPYALQAKKMDMRKLKAAVWQNLTGNVINVPKDTQERRGKVIPTTFSKVFRELPELLPLKMQKELSCSLAFVALLHLCNEQNLVLKQHPGFKDFDIK